MISLCHCLACQKRTGAPYSVAAIYAIDQTSTTGQSRNYSRSSDRGPFRIRASAWRCTERRSSPSRSRPV